MWGGTIVQNTGFMAAMWHRASGLSLLGVTINEIEWLAIIWGTAIPHSLSRPFRPRETV
ncbi:hypothetical protein GCM10010319_00260 [Streptomyces blastmyceticus]|uniref:Uncharacterized protein n=1 Tax=Streptomyces blastmyceticus TaxID=68180 RepID=A0ABP3FWH8_9ACTN